LSGKTTENRLITFIPSAPWIQRLATNQPGVLIFFRPR
jgi:hypothetical protein